MSLCTKWLFVLTLVQWVSNTSNIFIYIFIISVSSKLIWSLLKCLISFILQTLEIDSAWSNIAILIVENADGTNMENSSYPNQVFCLKCYPSLYNFTRGKLNANRTQLVIIEDIPNVDSCDPESFKDVDITDKVIII